MGNIPCYIIITCGGAGAAADTLALVEKSFQAPANYLAKIESEICELGPELAPHLDESERNDVFTAGARAEAMRVRIVDYLTTWHKMHERSPLTVEELWAFAESQRKVFFDLVDKYKDA